MPIGSSIAECRLRWGLAAVLVVVGLVAGCSDDGGDDSDGLTAEPFSLGLSVGECFDRPADPDVAEVPAVACRRPHDLEVFATFTLDDGEFPNRENIARLAGEGCHERFADYVGTTPDSSGLLIVPYAPDRLAWEQGDRQVTCAVSRPDGQLEGSVEGSERPA